MAKNVPKVLLSSTDATYPPNAIDPTPAMMPTVAVALRGFPVARAVAFPKIVMTSAVASVAAASVT